MAKLYDTRNWERHAERKWALTALAWVWAQLVYLLVAGMGGAFMANQQENRRWNLTGYDAHTGNPIYNHTNYHGFSIFWLLFLLNLVAYQPLVAVWLVVLNARRKYSTTRGSFPHHRLTEPVFRHHDSSEEVLRVVIVGLCWPLAVYLLGSWVRRPYVARRAAAAEVKAARHEELTNPFAGDLRELHRRETALLNMISSPERNAALAEVGNAIIFIEATLAEQAKDTDRIKAVNLLEDLDRLVLPAKIALETHRELMEAYHEADIAERLASVRTLAAPEPVTPDAVLNTNAAGQRDLY